MLMLMVLAARVVPTKLIVLLDLIRRKEPAHFQMSLQVHHAQLPLEPRDIRD